MRSIVLVIILLSILCSCVPNRKIVYLQKQDLHKKDLPIDSIVRKYEIESFNYRIQPNDILSIRFFSLTSKEFDLFANYSMQPNGIAANSSNPQLTGELVDENGEVPFPVAGKVKVAGLTVFEIQEKLQELANHYLESPMVKVRLLNYQVTILGEVVKQGSLMVPNNRASMLEVIGLAGGLDDFADRTKVKLIRQKGGKIDVQYLNLLDENFINSPYYYAYQNDVLIVPALRQRPLGKYTTQNVALLVSVLTLIILSFNLTK